MQALIRLALGGFALLAILVAAFFVAIDTVAGAAIERGASYALGVETKVGFVRIGLLKGTFRIRGLAIDNPPGFESDHLIDLGSGRLEVPLHALRQPIVVVPLMELDSVKVSLEKEHGNSNVGTVLVNLRRFESTDSPSGSAHSAEPGKRFVIEQIVIRDIAAHVRRSKALGNLGAIDLEIPEIRLHDVGAKNARGVSLSELTDIIVKAVFTAIVKTGVNLPEALVGDLRSGLGRLASVPIQQIGAATGAVTEKLPGGLRESARQLGAGAGEAGKKALDGIGNLFRGRKGDE